MRTCGRCGKMVPDGQNFCGDCGAPITQLLRQEPNKSPFAPPSSQTAFQQPANTSYGQPYQNQQAAYQQPMYRQPTPTSYTTPSNGNISRSQAISIVALVLAILSSLTIASKSSSIYLGTAISAIVFAIIGIKKSNKTRSIVAFCIAVTSLFVGVIYHSGLINKQETKSTTSNQLPFTVSSETKNLHIGEIAKDGDFYYGLVCVRSSDKVQTAFDSIAYDISDSKEVIYPIIEVYNGSGKIADFSVSNNLALYVDSVKASQPSDIFMPGIDGIKRYQSYNIDSKKTALVLNDYEVEKGWNELTVFCGNISWTITQDDISYEPYKHKSLYNLSPDSYTEEGSKIYSGDYEIVFDGFEVYEFDSKISGKTNYAMFKFTINNTSDSKINYRRVGKTMKCYWNTLLLKDPTSALSEKNGYKNIFDIDEIHPGMTAKFYVAFEIDEENGVFECIGDTGPSANDRIVYACCKNPE